jgi:predicted TPR repeat methyltransferase
MNATSTPVDPLARPLQGIENLINQGKLHEAAQQLNTVAKVAANDARIHLLGCRLAEVAGNLQGSIDAARNAVACAPGWKVAVMELAMALARADQLPEALHTAQKAVLMDPNDPALLGRAVDVAHRGGRLDAAVAYLRRIDELAPGQRPIRHLLARDLRLLGEHDESIATFTELVEGDPADTGSRIGRLQTALAAGNATLAQADAAALLERNPDDEVFRFWADMAHGRTPERQPPALVRELFDGAAAGWDQHIVAKLKYKLPKLVADQVRQWHPGLQLNVLDLGCGTGLLGVALGRIEGALVGVDISLPMLQQASRHNVYDKFHHADLLAALRDTPEALYDVIAALDVLIYTGALAEAIPNAHRILKPGGRFVFSCELADEEEADQVLRATQRFAHKLSWVEGLCKAAGFSVVEVEKMPLRYEGAEQVQGFVVIATK